MIFIGPFVNTPETFSAINYDFILVSRQASIDGWPSAVPDRTGIKPVLFGQPRESPGRMGERTPLRTLMPILQPLASGGKLLKKFDQNFY